MRRIPYFALPFIIVFLLSLEGSTNERTLLVLADAAGEQNALAKSFSSELKLVLEDSDVLLIPFHSADFVTKDDDFKITEANQLLKHHDAQCLVWLEIAEKSVCTIGLLVSSKSGTLAKVLTFENKIGYMPELAVLTHELFEHALAYEEEELRRAQEEGAEQETEASGVLGAEVKSDGLGKKIPAPDGWTRVESDLESAEEGEGKAGKEGDKSEDSKEKEDEADEKENSEEAKEGEGDKEDDLEAKSAEDDEDLGDGDGGGKGKNKQDAVPIKNRRFTLEPIVDLNVGFGDHTGSMLWIGGGGGFAYWIRPALYLRIAVVAQGGPFPRYDKENLFGWRIIPALSAGYLFKIGGVRLGPAVQLALTYHNITIHERGYIPIDRSWLGFRASAGARFWAEVNQRLAVTLEALLGVYATKGKLFNAGENVEIYKTPLGESTIRAGLVIYF